MITKWKNIKGVERTEYKDKTICIRDGGCPYCSPVRSLYLVNGIIYYNEPGLGCVVLDESTEHGFRICVMVHDTRDPEFKNIPYTEDWAMGRALETEYDVDYALVQNWQLHTGEGLSPEKKREMIVKLRAQFTHKKEVIV